MFSVFHIKFTYSHIAISCMVFMNPTCGSRRYVRACSISASSEFCFPIATQKRKCVLKKVTEEFFSFFRNVALLEWIIYMHNKTREYLEPPVRQNKRERVPARSMFFSYEFFPETCHTTNTNQCQFQMATPLKFSFKSHLVEKVIDILRALSALRAFILRQKKFVIKEEAR